MTTRTARCGCGRVELTVEGEPTLVNTCHCDFCQKRSGSVFATNAHFAEDQVVAITGDTKIYNGLEIDGVGTAGSGPGIDYHFCATCGSTVYWDFAAPGTGSRTFLVAVGNFEDPDFPVPTVEVFTRFRHHWVRPVPDAVQFFDPLDGSAPIDSMLPSARKEAGTERAP
jgi:hypothetical protein